MFAVPDVDAAADMVRQRGGKIVLGPMDSPVCRLAWCIDPDGNTFALPRSTASVRIAPKQGSVICSIPGVEPLKMRIYLAA